MGVRARVPLVVLLAVSAGGFSLVLETPARAVDIPRTLARTLHLDERAPGRTRLPLAPTHLAFSWRGSEGAGVRFRTTAAGGWSRAPEAHDAHRGDDHFSAVLTVDRPRDLEWRPIVPRGGWIDDVTLDVINTEDGPTVTVEIPRVAEAAARAPKIVTRAEWGADESLKRTKGSCRRVFFDVQQLFVHHTAGRNNDPNPKATMRAIYWYHAVRQGWCDVGYNFIIGSDGKVYEGRWARSYRPWEIHSSEDTGGRAVSGAHVGGYNQGSVGISLMGNFHTAPVPQTVRRSLAKLLAWEADRHGLRPKGTHTYRNPSTGVTRRLPYIAGHRDAGDTSCPGRYLYRALPGIRDDVKSVIAGGKSPSSMSFSVPKRVAYGDAVTLSGRVLDKNGTGLPNKSVILYSQKYRRRWRVASTTTTGVDGSFSFGMTPSENLKLAAVYEGDAGTWGSQSDTRRLKVRPNVTLAPEGATVDRLGVYWFPAGTSTVVLAGGVSPSHPGKSARVKVAAVHSDGTSGEVLVKQQVVLDASGGYRYEYRVPGPGRYRASTWFIGDGDHAGSPSGPVEFVVDP